jgi:hypothetical protein
MYGIDAPETNQDFGSREKEVASSLAFGKSVTIRPRTTDRYGRLVADVFLPGGQSLNHELVRHGMAWWYREYAPHDAELERLEAEARQGEAGIVGATEPDPALGVAGRSGRGRRDRQPAVAAVPRPELPERGRHEGGEPGRVRHGRGGGESGVSPGRGLPMSRQEDAPEPAPPTSGPFFSSFGPADGPILARHESPALGVLASPDERMPIGIAFPTGLMAHRKGPAKTFRLVIGKTELSGRWICEGRRFVPLGDAAEVL